MVHVASGEAKVHWGLQNTISPIIPIKQIRTHFFTIAVHRMQKQLGLVAIARSYAVFLVPTASCYKAYPC